MLFRELEFPLAEIKRILSSPAYDANEALRDQLKLLELRRERLNEIIEQTKAMLEKGEKTMDFSAFKHEEYERYARETKEKWGNTPEYAEYEAKLKKNGAAAMGSAGEKLMQRFAEFGALRGGDPAGDEAQAAVCGLQAFITENFYTCSDKILLSLSKMYGGGGSMTESIDKVGGPGTGEFAERAIAAHCQA